MPPTHRAPSRSGTSEASRELLTRIFDGLAVGDGTAFRESLADSLRWTVIGTTAWSGTYEGKRAVHAQLLGPLFARLAGRYTNTAYRILADGEYAVIECRGQATTTAGMPYHNTYCWVCRVVDGKIVELTEYCDTALIAAVLGDPRSGPDGRASDASDPSPGTKA